MKKKFICPICGYVHEGEEAPERCPQCKQVVEWKVVDESAALNFVTEHVLGIAKGTGDDMIKDLNAHYMAEATEVGMYLAMSRQADREGYPEIAEASSALPLKKPNTAPSSPSCWAKWCGTPRPTSTSE